VWGNGVFLKLVSRVAWNTSVNSGASRVCSLSGCVAGLNVRTWADGHFGHPFKFY
jgi:hypothetical protein